jgi:hypothetical protein
MIAGSFFLRVSDASVLMSGDRSKDKGEEGADYRAIAGQCIV